MTITFTQVWSRPNTSVPFHHDADLPGAQFARQMEVDYEDVLHPHITVSSDGLTMTKTQSHANIDTLNQTRNVYKNMDLLWEFYCFAANTGQHQVSYSVSGLDEPFTVTTEYSFPTGANVSYLVNAMHSPNGAVDRLDGNIELTDHSLKATHFYVNGDFWNETRWIDFMFTQPMHDNGVTFKETWKLVNHLDTAPPEPTADTPPAPTV